MRHRQITLRVSSQGFGLVELMIAMALGLVIILGVTTLFTDSSKTMDDMGKAGNRIENSLFATEFLATELMHAGYWGEAGFPIFPDTQIFRAGETPAAPPAATMPLPPPACLGLGSVKDSGGSYTFSAKEELAYGMAYPIYSATGADLNADIAACVLGYAEGEGPISASTARATSEYFVVRRASTCQAGVGACPAVNGSFHLQTNGCYNGTSLFGGEIRLSNDPTDFNYDAFDCTTDAPIYRYVSRIYYVDQSDNLVMLELQNDGTQDRYVAQTLVEGVEVMRFEWYIDTTGDGEPDVITRGPSTLQWTDVVAVKLWLVVRSTEEDDSYTDTNDYVIAGETYDFPSGNDHYQRSVHSRVIDLVNIGGRRR